MYTPTQEQIDRIENNFTYHSPNGTDQVARYGGLREAYKELALMLIERCPNSRELSLALTDLESSVMWANASIARNE